MQFKVPQNIDMEDKIIGPFTMKQFIYLLVAGTIIYGWWNYLSKSYTNFTLEFVAVAIPVGLLGMAFALVKVNDRPFEVFALNLLKFLFSPKQRKWVGGYQGEPVIILDKAEEAPKEQVQKSEEDLDALAKSLDKRSAEIRQKEMPAIQVKRTAKGAPAAGATLSNLSVKDVKSAAQKQAEAQKGVASSQQQPAAGSQNQQTAQTPAPPPKKSGGIFGFFKK
jgi:uncharacterized phage infection (PIP) family protein YhgE